MTQKKDLPILKLGAEISEATCERCTQRPATEQAVTHHGRRLLVCSECRLEWPRDAKTYAPNQCLRDRQLARAYLKGVQVTDSDLARLDAMVERHFPRWGGSRGGDRPAAPTPSSSKASPACCNFMPNWQQAFAVALTSSLSSKPVTFERPSARQANINARCEMDLSPGGVNSPNSGEDAGSVKRIMTA